MLIGGVVIVTALIVIGVIANSGRISSNTGNELTVAGFKTQKRNSCITDLRNESDYQRGEVLAAVLNRLVVLDGKDPETGKDLPLVRNEDGEMAPDKNRQAMLADFYDTQGLIARAKSQEVSRKLLQPTLNELCGEPVTEKEDVDN